MNVGSTRYDLGPYDIVWIYRCTSCSAQWLRVLFESYLSRSGHWYDCLLPEGYDGATIEPIEVREIEELFQHTPICFCGGSYFRGEVHAHNGIPLRRV